jgi:carboxylesterase type B
MNDNEGGIATLAGQGAATFSGIMSVPASCSARDAALVRRKAGISAWRYRFYGEFPNTEIDPKAGAWHGIEEFAVFGTAEFLTKIPETKEQIDLGKKVREAWSSFAKDPVNGLLTLGWPVYDDNSK